MRVPRRISWHDISKFTCATLHPTICDSTTQDNRHEEEHSYDKLFPIVGSRSPSPCALSLGAFFAIFCSRLTQVINHCSNYLQDITTCNSKDVKPSSFFLVWLSYPNSLTGALVHAKGHVVSSLTGWITKNGVGWDYLKIRNVTQLYPCPVRLEKSARHVISSRQLWFICNKKKTGMVLNWLADISLGNYSITSCDNKFLS